MSDNMTNSPSNFLRTVEATEILNLSARTLEKHRVYGTGPKYFKLGGRVMYKFENLLAWARPGARRSTSDPGTGTVPPCQTTGAVAKTLGHGASWTVHPATPTRKKLI